METMQVIGIIVMIALVAIGLTTVIISLFGSTDKRKKLEKEGAIILPSNIEYKSTSNTPYEDLWRKAGCIMRGSSYLRLATMALEEKKTGTLNPAQRETIYKDEILYLMDKGMLYKQDQKNTDLRKFCIEQTPCDRSSGYRIKDAEALCNYIVTGKASTINNKEE